MVNGHVEKEDAECDLSETMCVGMRHARHTHNIGYTPSLEES